MKKIDEILIPPTMQVLQALDRLDRGAAQAVLVVDEGGHLLGVVTDGDVRRGLLRGVTLDRPVSDVMNTTPLTCAVNTSPEMARVLMQEHTIHQLPVIDAAGRVTDLITLDSTLKTIHQDTTVILMAGGLGSRLRPLTDSTPKPLLPIGGRPLLEITISLLARQGFERFLISLNYKAEMFRDFFADGERLGVQIDYIEESEKLGTAGALRLLPERPSSPFIVMNGDVLTTLDARRLISFHREQQAVATMCVREYEWSIPYGVVCIDNGRLAGFDEKPSRSEFVNAGIYVLAPEALDYIPASGAVDMPTLFQAIGQKVESPSIYPLREHWLDVGHLADLQRAQDEVHLFV